MVNNSSWNMWVYLLIVGLVNYASSESCYSQRCLACRKEQIEDYGSPVACDPANWVNAAWVHNLGHQPPSTASRVPLEYRCLKMVATPDEKSYGNTVDVLRGCVPRVQVDSVCLALEAVERARGHSDARCYVCRGNNCNTATAILTIPSAILFTSLTLHFVLR